MLFRSFGLVHQPPTVPPMILFGLFQGYLYHRTGSLVGPITLHFLFNLAPTVSKLLGWW